MLKKDFALRQIADMWVVLPLGAQAVDFSAMLTLNESGAMLWKAMESGADRNGLVAALLAEYDVDEATAKTAVEGFVAKLNENGFLA